MAKTYRAAFLHQVLSLPCNTKTQTARKLNKILPCANGSPIANAELLSQQPIGEVYAKKISHGRDECAAAVIQLPGFAGAE